MLPVQIYAFTPPQPSGPPPGENYVRYLQAFKLPNGNVELHLRNTDGDVNIIEMSTNEAMILSLALGAAKFPYAVVAERASRRP